MQSIAFIAKNLLHVWPYHTTLHDNKKLCMCNWDWPRIVKSDPSHAASLPVHRQDHTTTTSYSINKQVLRRPR